MKILVIEDEELKRNEIIGFFKGDEVELIFFEYVNPALKYILANKENISGIILDLGLETMPGAHDRTLYRGLDVVNELNRKKIDIPILINSTTEVDMIEAYPSVYGQTHEVYDLDIFDYFVSFLRRREEQ